MKYPQSKIPIRLPRSVLIFHATYADLGLNCKTSLTRNSISKGDGQRAILKREDGRLLKPIQPPPKGPRESEFYRDINRSNDPTDVAIRRHIPRWGNFRNFSVINILREIKFEEPRSSKNDLFCNFTGSDLGRFQPSEPQNVLIYGVFAPLKFQKIKFEEGRSSKTADFCNFRGSEFLIWVNFSLHGKNSSKVKFRAFKCIKMCSHCTSKII